MNANITKIEITETIQTMGDTTEIQARDFMSWIEEQLHSEYPNAELSLKLDNRQSNSTVYAESATDSDGIPIETEPEDMVREFINRCWDKWL